MTSRASGLFGGKPAGSTIIYLLALALLFMALLFRARDRALEDACLGDPQAPAASLATDAANSLCEALRLPDGRWWYTPDQVHATFENLGPGGRSIYALSQVLLDGPFPIIYGLLLGLMIQRFFVPLKLLADRGWLRKLALLPLLGVLSDLLENALTISTVATFDETASPSWLIWLAAPATLFKWLAVILSAGVAALGLLLSLREKVRRHGARRFLRVKVLGRLAKLMRYLFLVRVSVIVGAIMVALGALGSDSFATIENMMLLDGPGQLAVMTFLAMQTAGTVGFTGLVSWDYAHQRFGVGRWPLARRLSRPGVVRSLWFVPLSFPLINTAVLRSMAPPNGRLGTGDVVVGLVMGLGLAVFAAGGIEWLRVRVFATDKRRLGSSVSRALFGSVFRVFKCLGKGYWSNGEPLPGHVLATIGLALLSGLYAFGYWRLNPASPSWLFDQYPTVAFVLILVVIANILLSGLAFFFDAYRVPLLLALLALVVVNWNLGAPRDHSFEAELIERSSIVNPYAGRRLESEST